MLFLKLSDIGTFGWNWVFAPLVAYAVIAVIICVVIVTFCATSQDRLQKSVIAVNKNIEKVLKQTGEKSVNGNRAKNTPPDDAS